MTRVVLALVLLLAGCQPDAIPEMRACLLELEDARMTRAAEQQRYVRNLEQAQGSINSCLDSLHQVVQQERGCAGFLTIGVTKEVPPWPTRRR